MTSARSQRWRQRRHSFVPDATQIDKRDYSVDIIDDSTAKPFIIEHHYSGSFPASRLSCALYRNGAGGRSELVGVATFAHGANQATGPKWTGLRDPLASTELGRFVLLDDVPGNGETMFLARAFKLLRREKPDILSVVSFANPMRLVMPDGSIILPGHVGQIYSASCAARYLGRSTPRTLYFTPDGRHFSERSLSKARSGDRGGDAVIDALVRHGAPQPGGDISEWLKSLRTTGFFRLQRHLGNHTYVFPLTRAARHAGAHIRELDHPRLDAAIRQGDVTALPMSLPMAA